MGEVRAWIVGIISLVAGAAISYAFLQARLNDLNEQIASLQAQLTQTNNQVLKAASEIEALNDDLEAGMRTIEEQQVRIIELQAMVDQQVESAR